MANGTQTPVEKFITIRSQRDGNMKLFEQFLDNVIDEMYSANKAATTAFLRAYMKDPDADPTPFFARPPSEDPAPTPAVRGPGRPANTVPALPNT